MKIAIALGGNAILRRGEEGTAEEQFFHVRQAAERISGVVARGNRVLITHGNGPQVGDILLKEECARGILPRMPLDVCGAMSQGMIGYMLQQCLENALTSAGVRRPVLSVVTQTRVDPDDPAFTHPEKPVGPWYTAEEADLLSREHGWQITETGKGASPYRRVVPSPRPLEVIEAPSIKRLYDEGFVVIASGGGGIPVIDGHYRSHEGVEAVIDKDLTCALLATAVGASRLLILTDVPFACTGFGTPEEKPIGTIRAAEAKRLLGKGEFGAGSMAPKMEACIAFVRAGGEEAVITSLEMVEAAAEGEAGTKIIP